MGEKQGKVWGETSCLFFKNNIEIHRLESKAGSCCSKHKHEHKFNMFYVESGHLTVDVWKNDYDLVDRTMLNPGDSMIVKPGEYHQFISESDCVVYEIYWTELNQGDIVRESCGKDKYDHFPELTPEEKDRIFSGKGLEEQ
jgi:mannose-6-phosphate isomerase-like protein (cupin superfamily)